MAMFSNSAQGACAGSYYRYNLLSANSGGHQPMTELSSQKNRHLAGANNNRAKSRCWSWKMVEISSGI